MIDKLQLLIFLIFNFYVTCIFVYGLYMIDRCHDDMWRLSDTKRVIRLLTFRLKRAKR
jgi:hypothetical protein